MGEAGELSVPGGGGGLELDGGGVVEEGLWCLQMGVEVAHASAGAVGGGRASRGGGTGTRGRAGRVATSLAVGESWHGGGR